jgi:hypothetical protein
LADEQTKAVTDLEAGGEWNQIGGEARDSLLEETGLVPAAPPDLSTNAKLLESLDAVPLGSWMERISFITSRRDIARQRAAKLLEPDSVTVPLPSATIKTPTDLDNYVADVRAKVEPYLAEKRTVII